jgi:hypothetical protein
LYRREPPWEKRVTIQLKIRPGREPGTLLNQVLDKKPSNSIQSTRNYLLYNSMYPKKFRLPLTPPIPPNQI